MSPVFQQPAAPDRADMDTVMVLISVPRGWSRLPTEEIARKLRAEEPAITNMLATEIKRWAGSGVINLSALQKFIDDRTGMNDQPGRQS